MATSIDMTGPYLQSTVCKSVVKNLKMLYPSAFSHDFPLCIRCRESRTGEECRFKREAAIFCNWTYNFMLSEDFRQFLLQGTTIMVSFSDFAQKANAICNIPTLWNRNLASEPLYLRFLEVSFILVSLRTISL
jgi:hypothetical protein